MPHPVRIFISYAKEDSSYLQEFLAHFRYFQRTQPVELLYTDMAPAGAAVSEMINESILSADIILLFISANFLTSEFMRKYEKNLSLFLREKRKLIIPIYIKSVSWRYSFFGGIIGLPMNQQPINAWINRDEAWVGVVNDLAKIISLKSEQLMSANLDEHKRLSADTSPVMPNPAKAETEPPKTSEPLIKRALGWVQKLFTSKPNDESVQGGDKSPVRICIVSDPRDADAGVLLQKHLTALTHQGRVHINSVLLSADSRLPDEIFQGVANTHVLIIVLSPAFLNSTAATPAAVASLFKLLGEHGLSVMPIVYRDCDWRASPLARLPVRPYDGSALEHGDENDAGWLEVVEAITLIVDRRGRPAKTLSATDDRRSATTVPKSHYELDEVFKTVGFPEVTFVSPTVFDDLLDELCVRARVLVIEGPSGVGKTVAMERALEDLGATGRQKWPKRWLRIKMEADLHEAKSLPGKRLEDIQGHLIIDDFHMLPLTDRIRIGNFAKAFADGCRHDGKITLIGINHSRESLIHKVADLATRSEVRPLGRESNDKISSLITKGESALNTYFERKAEFSLTSNGSFVVAQMLCERALRDCDIERTQSGPRYLDIDPSRVVPSVVRQLEAQFHPDLQLFAMLDKESPGPRGAALVILWHLGCEPDGSIHITDVRHQWPRFGLSFDTLLAQVVRQRKLGVAPGWRKLLDCDPDAEQVALDDPKLAFYLRHMDWVEFGRKCNIKLKRTVEGGLQFLDTAQIKESPVPILCTPGVTTREVCILHISDLHFTARTKWDADTVFGRLVNDVKQLVAHGKQPDLLVVTGDVAFSGKGEEYELARKWLIDALLPATGLTTEMLVIVPGNHDSDRAQISRSAAALQRELLSARKQSDIAQILSAVRDRDVLLGRHEAFVKFTNDLKMSGRIWDLPWGTVSVNVRGLRVHVAALCSSWMSSGDPDKGTLLLGLQQVNEVFQGAQGADLVLSALHHPWSYFADFDRPAQAEVYRSSSLVLRGHLHEAEYVTQQSPMHGGVIEIAAGASYESSEYPNSYHFLAVDLDASKVRVYPRVWDKNRRDWTSDLNTFRGECGMFTLSPRRTAAEP